MSLNISLNISQHKSFNISLKAMSALAMSNDHLIPSSIPATFPQATPSTCFLNTISIIRYWRKTGQYMHESPSTTMELPVKNFLKIEVGLQHSVNEHFLLRHLAQSAEIFKNRIHHDEIGRQILSTISQHNSRAQHAVLNSGDVLNNCTEQIYVLCRLNLICQFPNHLLEPRTYHHREASSTNPPCHSNEPRTPCKSTCWSSPEWTTIAI